MEHILPILGTISLVLSALVTLSLAVGMKMFTMRAPSGPDAMGLAAVFFFQIGGLVFLLLGAFMGLGRGSFDWISSSGGIPTLAVLATGIGLSVLAVVATFTSMETRYRWRTLAGMSGAMVMPLFVSLYVLSLLWMPLDFIMTATWPRVVGWILAGLAAAVYVGAGIVWFQAQEAKGQRAIAAEQEREAERLRFAEEARQQDLLHAAALAAMPDNAPLEDFLSQLFIDKSEAHHARAMARIDALPDLVGRIGERLAHPLPIQREYCSNYIRHTQHPLSEFIPLLRQSTLFLARDYREGCKGTSPPLITHVKGLSWGAMLTLQRYPAGTFAAEVAELRNAVMLWPRSEERSGAIECIDRYLRGETVPA